MDGARALSGSPLRVDSSSPDCRPGQWRHHSPTSLNQEKPEAAERGSGQDPARRGPLGALLTPTAWL